MKTVLMNIKYVRTCILDHTYVDDQVCFRRQLFANVAELREYSPEGH